MAGGLARTTSTTKCSQWASGPRTAVLGLFLFPSLGCFRGPPRAMQQRLLPHTWGSNALGKGRGQAGKAPRGRRAGEAAGLAASGGLEGTAGPATALREAPRPRGARPAPGAPPGAATSAPGRPRQPPSWGCLRQRERRAPPLGEASGPGDVISQRLLRGGNGGCRGHCLSQGSLGVFLHVGLPWGLQAALLGPVGTTDTPCAGAASCNAP